VEELLHKAFARHERKDVFPVPSGKTYSQTFAAMVHLCLEPKDRITEMPVPVPAYVVPEAVLEIFAKGPQSAGFRVRPENVPNERDDMMTVAAGIGTETAACGAGEEFRLRMERDMDIYPFLGAGISDKAEIGFPSEVNMRNSRGLGQLEALFKNV